VFLNSSKSLWRALFSTSAARHSMPSRPAVEALEDRSLMDANAFVRGLYANILQRAPSDAEVNGWVSSLNSGMSMQSVTQAFIGSNEHLALIVNTDFTNFLGRPADPSALSYWTGQMANGMTQDQVAAAILGSPEYFALQGSSNSMYIQGVYFSVLDRSADGSVAYWNSQLASGASREQVAADILNSHEAHGRDVDQLYTQILHRSADPGGSQYWTNFLDSGGTESGVIQAITNSTEYRTDYGVSPD
jgi:Domain of unknown function (DUF4214)